MVFAGDGTYATPHFHSALNNAALLKLPFIYVLENNLYHQYAHYSYSCPMKDIADAARHLRIPGVVVDGQDVIQVYNAAQDRGRPRARRRGADADRGEDLPLLQPLGRARRRSRASSARSATTRWRSPRSGRSAKVRAWMARDPVRHLPQHADQLGRVDRAHADAIEAAAKKEAIEAFAWADQQPFCKPEDGLKNVFVEGTVAARQFG